MELIAFIVAGVAWYLLAWSLRKRGKGVAVRHGLGVVAFFLVAGLLLGPEEPAPDTQSADASNGTDSDGAESAKPYSMEVEAEGLASKYRVVKDDAMPPYKRSVELLIPERISEEEIYRIAQAVKADDRRDFERTFIGIRLEDNLDSDTYWATAHSNPDLEVRILGMTQEAHADTANVADSYEQLVGSWVVDRGPFSYTAALYIEDNKLYLDQVFSDGDKLTSELVVSDAGGRGVRLEEHSNEFGEYYTVDGAGNLRFWAKKDNYYTSRDVKEPFNREMIEVYQDG